MCLLFAGKQEHTIGTYFGRKVAVDASMSIYQVILPNQPFLRWTETRQNLSAESSSAAVDKFRRRCIGAEPPFPPKRESARACREVVLFDAREVVAAATRLTSPASLALTD